MLFSKKVFLFLFAFALSKNLCSQLNNDSLAKEFESLPSDSSSIRKILNFIESHRKKDIEACLASGKTAYAKSIALNNKFFIAKSELSLGNIYSFLSDYENALFYLTEAQKNAESINNKALLLPVILTIGNVYAYNHQYSKGLEMYENALKLSEELGDDLNRASIYNNIGGLTYRRSDLKKEEIRKAMGYFIKSIGLTEKSGDKSELPSKYCNMGLMYCELGQYDSAMVYLSKAKVIIDIDKLPDEEITYYSFLGRIYAEQKKYDEAEKNYFLSLEASRKMNSAEWISEAYLSLSDLYVASKDYAEALVYSNAHHRIDDSLVNVTNFAKAADIQNKFEREKKEAELSKIKAEQSRNKIFNIALILVSLLFVISAVMMYSRFKIKAESERKLQLQNGIIWQKNKDITDSINYSRKIQEAILPSSNNISELFSENFVLYQPKDIISGDFYWCQKVNHLKFFAVADCTGHGVPGALMSMLGTSLLKEIIITKNITATGEILNELRRLVIGALKQNSDSQKDGMDIALICYDEKHKKLHFSGANNSAQVITGNKLVELKPDKQPIGIYEHTRDFTSQTLEINSDTFIYLYTDGFADQFGGPKGKKFKYKQLDLLLLELSGMDLSVQRQKLNSTFESWKGNLEQVDDVCVVGLKISA